MEGEKGKYEGFWKFGKKFFSFFSINFKGMGEEDLPIPMEVSMKEIG